MEPLELAPSHGHRDLAQTLRASANSPKSVVSYMGFFLFEYIACVRVYRGIFPLSVCLAPSLPLWVYQ